MATVWSQWCGTTSTATTACTWVQWFASDTATATTITSTIWQTWCSSTVYYAPPQQSAEQRVHQQAEQKRWQEQAAEERKKREAAEARAKTLLEENLALKERERLRKDGHFIVHGRSGCRYRIRKGHSGNIDVIDKNGIITHRLCAHPAEYVPDHDTMLTQKLMLESDESEFLRIANRHAIYPPNERVLESLH